MDELIAHVVWAAIAETDIEAEVNGKGPFTSPASSFDGPSFYAKAMKLRQAQEDRRQAVAVYRAALAKDLVGSEEQSQ